MIETDAGSSVDELKVKNYNYFSFQRANQLTISQSDPGKEINIRSTKANSYTTHRL